jgi:predicted XRE-type DNA-binding protein
MNNTPKFESVWDALIDDPEDLKKKSDYLILIQARLYGQSGSEADKAEQFGSTVEQIHNLVNGRIKEFSLSQLIAIARKVGVTGITSLVGFSLSILPLAGKLYIFFITEYRYFKLNNTFTFISSRSYFTNPITRR